MSFYPDTFRVFFMKFCKIITNNKNSILFHDCSLVFYKNDLGSDIVRIRVKNDFSNKI